MNAIEGYIREACPLAFGGTSGGLFARTVASVVAAQCAFYDDYRWPRDRAEDIIRSTETVKYDFIVVGAGSAGSLLASRLAKHRPSWSVLLIEAGDDPGLDSEIPGLLLHAIDSDLDWSYNTHPDGNSCLSFKNHSCIWSKGKGLGGSSSINAMIYVRGHPNDYEKWNENKLGWGYEDIRHYFENIEDELGINEYKNDDQPWYKIIHQAWKELNYENKEPLEGTNEAFVGTRVAKLLIKDGKRLNTAKHFLKEYQNLHVMKNTKVQKVLIDVNTKTVYGVQVKHKNGIVMEIKASKEVILSAGSIMTPQILMLSGTGPRKHLEETKIDCLVDLPVGKNLQDHSILHLFFKTNLSTVISQDMLDFIVIQYMLTRTGPLSNIGIFDLLTFIDTNNDTYPNLQFYHSHYPRNDSILLKRNMKRMGYKDEIVAAIEKYNKESDIFMIHPSLLHPRSKGEILLKDNNPDSYPVIKANYFKEPADIEVYKDAIKYVQELIKTDSLAQFGMELIKLEIEECSSSQVDYWECYIKHIATTVYHPVGTAKMGSRDDIKTVVDENLKVLGINKLRVVDASVMPDITGGNTLAPTLVIAAKAADIITKAYRVKDEF